MFSRDFSIGANKIYSFSLKDNELTKLTNTHEKEKKGYKQRQCVQEA